MSFIELTEKEMLNVKIVDEQHIKFAGLLNKLHAELGAKFEGETKRLLDDLKITLREHFDTEEKLMKDTNYVNFFSHKMEHDRFYKKVEEYISTIASGKASLDLEFLKSGRRWFFNHFELNDKKCAEHWKAQGIA